MEIRITTVESMLCPQVLLLESWHIVYGKYTGRFGPLRANQNNSITQNFTSAIDMSFRLGDDG